MSEQQAISEQQRAVSKRNSEQGSAGELHPRSAAR